MPLERSWVGPGVSQPREAWPRRSRGGSWGACDADAASMASFYPQWRLPLSLWWQVSG